VIEELKRLYSLYERYDIAEVEGMSFKGFVYARHNHVHQQILQNFRDEEYFVPYKKLNTSGFNIITASTRVGEITGMLGRKANAGFYYARGAGAASNGYWREGSHDVAGGGHRIGYVVGSDDTTICNADVICNSSLEVDVRTDAAGTATLTMNINGWYLPIGM